MRTILALVALTTYALPALAQTPSPQPGKQVPTSVTVTTDVDGKQQEVEIRYLLFLPKGYQADGPAMPVILFLHGAGERGKDIELVKKWGPPRIVENNAAFPFIVVSPQCPQGRGWHVPRLLKLVDHVCESLNADRERLYVTGLSMGGRSTWDLIAAAPRRFAAGIPLCGPGNPRDAEKLVGTPLWAVQGGKDRPRFIEGMQAMADAEAVGKAAVTYDGMMIDYAHVRNALDLLNQAEAFGIEVGEYPEVKAL